MLGFADSGWDGPAPANVLVNAGRRSSPRSTGHRDHAAIGAATTTTLTRHGDATTLYHWCPLRSVMDRWVAERGGDAGVYAGPRLGRLEADITTLVDGEAVLDARRSVIAAHASQASPFLGLSSDPEAAFLTGGHLVRVVPAGPVGAGNGPSLVCSRRTDGLARSARRSMRTTVCRHARTGPGGSRTPQYRPGMNRAAELSQRELVGPLPVNRSRPRARQTDEPFTGPTKGLRTCEGDCSGRPEWPWP